MPSCAAGERNGLPANSGTTPARALERRRTLQRCAPALWKRGRFRKGLGESRKSGRCNLAGSGRDRRRSHPLRPSRAHGRRDETRQHEPTPESSEAASHTDGPDRFAKLARYHNDPWCAGNRVDHQALSFAKTLVSRFRSSHTLAAPSDANFGIKGTLATYNSSVAFGFEVPKRARGHNDRNFKSTALAWDHAWGLPAPPGLIISMAVFSTAEVRFLRRLAFGRSR
jgi:hypothetical protein